MSSNMGKTTKIEYGETTRDRDAGFRGVGVVLQLRVSDTPKIPCACQHACIVVYSRCKWSRPIYTQAPPTNTAHVLASQERDQQDATVLEQKMNGLRMSHTRRTAAMDAAQAARVAALQEKCVAEIEELKGKQKAEYDVLVSGSPVMHYRPCTAYGTVMFHLWTTCRHGNLLVIFLVSTRCFCRKNHVGWTSDAAAIQTLCMDKLCRPADVVAEPSFPWHRLLRILIVHSPQLFFSTLPITRTAVHPHKLRLKLHFYLRSARLQQERRVASQAASARTHTNVGTTKARPTTHESPRKTSSGFDKTCVPPKISSVMSPINVYRVFPCLWRTRNTYVPLGESTGRCMRVARRPFLQYHCASNS